jgi:hypothetical protein
MWRPLIAVIIVALYTLVVIVLSRIHVARRAILVFVIAGSVLSLLRIGTLIYLSHRMQSHTFSASLLPLSYILVPEVWLFSLIRQPNFVLDTLLTSTALIIGSFVWALPFLLLWGAPKRQLG